MRKYLEFIIIRVVIGLVDVACGGFTVYMSGLITGIDFTGTQKLIIFFGYIIMLNLYRITEEIRGK